MFSNNTEFPFEIAFSILNIKSFYDIFCRNTIISFLPAISLIHWFAYSWGSINNGLKLSIVYTFIIINIFKKKFLLKKIIIFLKSHI